VKIQGIIEGTTKRVGAQRYTKRNMVVQKTHLGGGSKPMGKEKALTFGWGGGGTGLGDE